MKVAVIGTGVVGQTIAGKCAELGHDVVIGTRDVEASMAKTEPGQMAPGIGTWIGEHPGVTLATMADAAAHGEVVFLATSGNTAVHAIELCGPANLEGKVIVDISNPLDFSQGFPPRLTVCNDDSIGEQVQAAAPGAKVVKALNTVNALLMVDPRQLNDGDHTIVIAGNDDDAKATVTGILTDWFGWRDVLDLGTITAARGTEMYLPFWTRAYGQLGTGNFNMKVVR